MGKVCAQMENRWLLTEMFCKALDMADDYLLGCVDLSVEIVASGELDGIVQ